MKHRSFQYVLCLVVLFGSIVFLIPDPAFSQASVPALPGAPDPAPLGSGVVYLVGAGGLLAYRKLRRG